MRVLKIAVMTTPMVKYMPVSKKSRIAVRIAWTSLELKLPVGAAWPPASAAALAAPAASICATTPSLRICDGLKRITTRPTMTATSQPSETRAMVIVALPAVAKLKPWNSLKAVSVLMATIGFTIGAASM